MLMLNTFMTNQRTGFCMIGTTVMNESNCVSTAKLCEIIISLFKKISISCNVIDYIWPR